MAKKNNWIKGIILAVLIGVGGWAIFQLSLYGMSSLLSVFGIENPVWQYLSIIGIVLLIIIVGWHNNFKDAVKKLVR